MQALWSAPQQADEHFRGRIDTRLVAGGYQVEQQPADHGQPESCRGGLGQTLGESQPVIDRARNHPVEWLLSIGGSRITLEEEALERSQFRPADVVPHRGEMVGWATRQIGQDSHLATLDLFNDRHQHIFSRTEVVQEHSMACTDRGGYIAQGSVADTAGGELLDQRVQ
jgi:hypothetical protein